MMVIHRNDKFTSSSLISHVIIIMIILLNGGIKYEKERLIGFSCRVCRGYGDDGGDIVDSDVIVWG